METIKLLFDYMGVALIISLFITLSYILLLVFIDVFLNNRLGYLMKERSKAEHAQDIDRLTYLNDKISASATLLRRIEKLSYFDFY